MTGPERAGAGGPIEPPTVLALASTFSRIALESVGGGLAAWMQRVIVDERGWLTQDDYLSASTICGILPGANQVNLAVFVGTRYRGFPGALAAVAGLVAAPAVVALVVAALYLQYRTAPALRHALAGMSCAAVGLAISVAYRQARGSLTSWPALALASATFAASALVRVPLWLTLTTLAPLAFWWAWRRTGEHVPR